MRAKAKVIIEHNGCLLLLKPIKRKKFTLIGGTVNKKELPIDTIVREAYEEAGVIIDKEKLAYFCGKQTVIADKIYYFNCFILQGEDVDFKLKEKNKFKYVDWIPVHEGLEKLKGIEFKMVNKLIKDRSKPEKNTSKYLKMG